jgi:hypothetical protein
MDVLLFGKRICNMLRSLVARSHCACHSFSHIPYFFFTCLYRPSGTEDVVRVYVEAETPALANDLAVVIMQLVYDYGGGTGERATRESLH